MTLFLHKYVNTGFAQIHTPVQLVNTTIISTFLKTVITLDESLTHFHLVFKKRKILLHYCKYQVLFLAPKFFHCSKIVVASKIAKSAQTCLTVFGCCRNKSRLLQSFLPVTEG